LRRVYAALVGKLQGICLLRRLRQAFYWTSQLTVFNAIANEFPASQNREFIRCVRKPTSKTVGRNWETATRVTAHHDRVRSHGTCEGFGRPVHRRKERWSTATIERGRCGHSRGGGEITGPTGPSGPSNIQNSRAKAGSSPGGSKS
jgi:hypothetical protein